MNDIILNKFQQWTKGLNPRQAAISIFNHIRDIPYMIVPQLRDPVAGPLGLLEYNCGMCTPKHFLLAQMFEELNIPVKFATYQFIWDDPKIRYPQDLKEMAEGIPVDYHLACKVYIENRWILVDATYDLPLGKFGFPVTENWDGLSDTRNAVTPLKEVIHRSLQERIDYVIKQKTLYAESQIKRSVEFKEQLNIWLERIRKGYKKI